MTLTIFWVLVWSQLSSRFLCVVPRLCVLPCLCCRNYWLISWHREVFHTSCLRGLGKKKHCLDSFWSVEWTWEGPMTSEWEKEVLLSAHIYSDWGELEMMVMITCVCVGAWLWKFFFFFCKELSHTVYTSIFLYGRHIQLLPVSE